MNRLEKLQILSRMWNEAIGDCELKHDDIENEIRVIMPNQTYYLINLYQVYSNRLVFHMTTTTFMAVKKTFDWLIDQVKENNNEQSNFNGTTDPRP